MKIIFWNYDLLHLKISSFSIELYDLSITLNELLTRVRYLIINDNSRIINFLKMRKTNPREFVNEYEKNWNLQTTLIDYIDYYKIYNNIDIIYKIDSI